MAGTVAQQFAFRAATSDDAAFAADVMTAVTPESPWDPVSLRYWWSQPDEFVEIVRFIVLRGERLMTLAEDTDPDVITKVWRLSEEAGDDVPTTVPRIPEAIESYTRWANAPEIHRDRFWIARVGDDIVGVSVLGYPPMRGIVGTEWTATARAL